MRGGKVERAAVTARQQSVLARAAAMPDRPDSVDDVFRWQAVATRDLGRPGFATAKRSAFGEQFRSGGAMDRAVNAATAEERFVGRIDDGVDRKRCDVGNADFEPGRTDFSGE